MSASAIQVSSLANARPFQLGAVHASRIKMADFAEKVLLLIL